MSDIPPRPSNAKAFLRRALFWIAILALFGIALCEWFQPDALAAITAIPPWCWLIACVGLAILGVAAISRRERIVAALVVLAFLVVSVEQTASLARAAWRAVLGNSHEPAVKSLRAVTLNCNVGSRVAAGEVARFKPDLVFLQESPTEQVVQELAESLFGPDGSVVWSPDCSIIARGQLQRSERPNGVFVQAVWTFEGHAIEVVCLRLSPPIVRYDLWAPSSWREHTHLRRKHRAEAMAITQTLLSVPSDRPILIGGDCNAPAGDGALQVWAPRLRDVFRSAGHGWGNTVLNNLPALRFDQLWCSDNLKPVAIWAEKSAPLRPPPGNWRFRTDATPRELVSAPPLTPRSRTGVSRRADKDARR